MGWQLHGGIASGMWLQLGTNVVGSPCLHIIQADFLHTMVLKFIEFGNACSSVGPSRMGLS